MPPGTGALSLSAHQLILEGSKTLCRSTRRTSLTPTIPVSAETSRQASCLIYVVDLILHTGTGQRCQGMAILRQVGATSKA